MATLYAFWFVIASAVCAVYGGVTKPSGIEQFWMDDIKVFDQIYGKTSDKQLYGATLPPTVRFDTDLKKKIKSQESQKKERYSSVDDVDLDSEEQFYPFGDRYAKEFNKKFKNDKVKNKSPLHFVGLSSFKPISQSSDPETYNYLKHLEHFEKHKTDLTESENDFKPFIAKTEEEDAYKSIQDILDAHEANKEHKSESESNESFEKYPRHGPKYDNYKPFRYAANAVPTKSKVRFLNNNSLKSRCRSGRCRKRLSSSYRPSTRPYVRKIKRYRIA